MKKIFFKQGNKYKKGVVLVFAIILSVILFTFAAGVLNIATKELNFSTSAKDSNNAFYAADSGVECALENDMSTKHVFLDPAGDPPPDIDPVACFGDDNISSTPYPKFEFILLDLGPGGQACAKVLVEKNFDLLGSTRITSKGYNMGSVNNCDQTGLNSTERVIEVIYS
jgi:hypothetical protein